MSKYKKNAVIVFLTVLISSVAFWQIYKIITLGKNTDCNIDITSQDTQFSLGIKNRSLFFDFVNQLTNCSENMVVYVDDAGTVANVQKIQINFTSQEQTKKIIESGKVDYSWSTVINANSLTINVQIANLDLDGNSEIDKLRILTVVSTILTKTLTNSYIFPPGVAENIDSLDKIGLAYEI